VLGRQRRIIGIVQPGDIGTQQLVGVDPAVEDTKTSFAPRHNRQQTVFGPIEILDDREGSHAVTAGRAADFAARLDRADTEALLFTHTLADHVEITRFENP
jgi:hypothetical protein